MYSKILHPNTVIQIILLKYGAIVVFNLLKLTTSSLKKPKNTMQKKKFKTIFSK